MKGPKSHAPDWNVKVAQAYKDKDGHDKRRWLTVGAAWNGEYGEVYFTIATTPCVDFKLEPAKPEVDK